MSTLLKPYLDFLDDFDAGRSQCLRHGAFATMDGIECPAGNSIGGITVAGVHRPNGNGHEQVLIGMPTTH